MELLMGRENIRASLVWETCLGSLRLPGCSFPQGISVGVQVHGWLAGRDKGLAIENLVLRNSSALLWAHGLGQVAEPL